MKVEELKEDRLMQDWLKSKRATQNTRLGILTGMQLSSSSLFCVDIIIKTNAVLS